MQRQINLNVSGFRDRVVGNLLYREALRIQK